MTREERDRERARIVSEMHKLLEQLAALDVVPGHGRPMTLTQADFDDKLRLAEIERAVSRFGKSLRHVHDPQDAHE